MLSQRKILNVFFFYHNSTQVHVGHPSLLYSPMSYPKSHVITQCRMATHSPGEGVLFSSINSGTWKNHIQTYTPTYWDQQWFERLDIGSKSRTYKKENNIVFYVFNSVMITPYIHRLKNNLFNLYLVWLQQSCYLQQNFLVIICLI